MNCSNQILIYFIFLTGKIPDQFHALKLMAPSNAVAGVQPSQNWPSTVINQVSPTIQKMFHVRGAMMLVRKNKSPIYPDIKKGVSKKS